MSNYPYQNHEADCEDCGATIRVGDWPFCPHGKGANTVIGDDIPGGFIAENLGDKPEVFYSKKAMLAREKSLGLERTEKWAGPSDKHLSRWV